MTVSHSVVHGLKLMPYGENYEWSFYMTLHVYCIVFFEFYFKIGKIKY